MLCTECFHIRSCCSIFNDQPRLHSFRRDSLYIIPQTFPFVNTFFKSFLTFFKVFSSSLGFAVSRFSATFILYHKASVLSIPFSKVFYLFSKAPPRSLCVYPAALSDSLYIISLSSPFVKGFFHIFFNLVLVSLCTNSMR